MKTKLKVYLMGGQSNMCGCAPVADLPAELAEPYKGAIIFARGELAEAYDGEYPWGPIKPRLGANWELFGPEITFSRDMVEANGGELIALLKCAWGGTNLQYQWRPPSSGGQIGELYTKFVQAVRYGLDTLDSSYEPEIKGMIWMQGEADALESDMYADYEQNLTNLIHDIRTELALPDMPFVHAQIMDCDTYNPPGWGAEVRQAQENVAAKVPNTATFSTSDFKLFDPWHYDAPSMIELGRRFADSIKRLVC